MGLLDTFMRPSGRGFGLLDDPQQAGLLTTALGLLSASGPSTTPIGFSQAAGRAGLLGIQAYQSALDSQSDREDKQMMRDYRKAQIGELNRKAQSANDLDTFFKNRLYGTLGAMPAADMDASTQALGQGAQMGDIGPTVTNAQRMNTIRPPQLQGQNSAFPFGLNDVAYLKAKGVDLSDVYKLATDPVQMTGGSVYRDRMTGQERYIPKLPDGMTMGPGGAASVVPGFIQGNNAIKGGETYSTELGKAQLDPFFGMDGSGNKVLMGNRAQALGVGGPGGFPGVGGPGGQGTPASFGGTVTERNPGAVAYDTDINKSYAERFKAINNAGFTAPSQIAKLQRIGQLLEDHDGGKFSNNAMALSQYANSMGIKLDPKLGNKEAANALSNELALALRDPSNGAGMPGAMSDSDRQFLTSMAPNLSQSKEGRQQMINAGIALQKRNMQVTQMASKYQRKYGRVDDGFYTQLQDWADRNPLFGGQ